MLHANDWSCIHPLIHHDRGDPGLPITGKDRCGDRARTAMARQERWMQVDDATRIVIQEFGRDDLSEVCEERSIGAERFDSCDFSSVTNLGDMFDS